MMCRVGNDLCTAATAAVVIDRMELDEQDTISQLPSPGTQWWGRGDATARYRQCSNLFDLHRA